MGIVVLFLALSSCLLCDGLPAVWGGSLNPVPGRCSSSAPPPRSKRVPCLGPPHSAVPPHSPSFHPALVMRGGGIWAMCWLAAVSYWVQSGPIRLGPWPRETQGPHQEREDLFV